MRTTEPAEDSFPRRSARTGRFTFGAPRLLQPSADGERVAFLRSGSGTQRATSLWVLDVAAATERLVVDPADLLSGAGENLSAEERSRRERMRESGAGITSLRDRPRRRRLACFALSSRLFVADLTGPAGALELAASGAVIDPRPSPDGSQVAYAAGGACTSSPYATRRRRRPLAEPESAQVSYGLADFAAAEELERHRGYWWAPDSSALLVARVDEAPVQVWHIADPENPANAPHRAALPVGRHAERRRHPLAARPRRLAARGGLGPRRLPVPRHRALVRGWRAARPGAQPAPGELAGPGRRRRHRGDLACCASRPTRSGSTSSPAPRPGRESASLLTVEVVEDRYALLVDGRAVSPPGGPGPRRVGRHRFRGPGRRHRGSPTEHVYVVGAGDWQRLTAPGSVNVARAGGDLLVTVRRRRSSRPRATRDGTQGRRAGRGHRVVRRRSRVLAVRTLPDPGAPIPTAVLLPRTWSPGDEPLPVLLDPYGGPHLGRVSMAARGYLESQWWADQGFAVVICDGRGTPGAPSWERTVRLDLTDRTARGPGRRARGRRQAAARRPRPRPRRDPRLVLRRLPRGARRAAAARRLPRRRGRGTGHGLDAVRHRVHRALPRPARRAPGGVRSAARCVATGAQADPAAADHPRPRRRQRGGRDTRCACRRRCWPPGARTRCCRCPGVTHMTPQEVVAENLLLLQLDFLRRSLALPTP